MLPNFDYEMSEPNEIVLPCDPASTRRSLVSGPVSEKLVTEDCEGVGTQAHSSVNRVDRGESDHFFFDSTKIILKCNLRNFY